MPDSGRKRLLRTTILFWLLLIYIIAALIWWYISLERQNTLITEQQYSNLELLKSSLSGEAYREHHDLIELEARRTTRKYVAEGITFLLLILTGAVFVYRAVRKQFLIRHQQENFMMAVTHELKTPISVTKLNLETLQKYKLDEAKQNKLLRATLDETARLDFLTNNILLSAQLEGGRYRSTQEDLDLSTLFADCIEDFRNRYPDRNFTAKIDSDTDIKGDPLLLQMMINNLLENAIKYSPKESTVSAVLEKKPAAVQLKVIDEGPGVPDAEKTKIFTKFYRVGNENTRKAQGTGLGLYLCNKIARAHNADISVTNHLPQGSIFTVSFKL
jgi:signal transduction histidine kinase